LIKKAGKESRISTETRIVEDFLGELAKDGLVSYGKDEIEKAVNLGAVEKLLVSEKIIRKNEKLMEKAEKNGAEIVVISEVHESGQKLSRLGGLAAFLRFKTN